MTRIGHLLTFWAKIYLEPSLVRNAQTVLNLSRKIIINRVLRAYFCVTVL